MPSAALTTFGYANEIADLLGLNNWELYQAQYNGCSFMTVVPQVPTTINPVQGIIDIAQSTGLFNNDNNDPNAVLYATTMHMLQAQDDLRRKFIRHKIPNSNTDVMEDLGWEGFSFKMNAIFNGSNYFIGLNNFLQRVINENANKATIGNNFHVLQHPVLGKLNDTYLTNSKQIHESKVFKGVTLELTFECSNAIINTPKLSFLNNIGQNFDMLQQAIFSVAQTVTLTNLVTL